MIGSTFANTTLDSEFQSDWDFLNLEFEVPSDQDLADWVDSERLLDRQEEEYFLYPEQFPEDDFLAAPIPPPEPSPPPPPEPPPPPPPAPSVPTVLTSTRQPPIKKQPAFDESQLRRYLKYMMDPSTGAMEMRVLGASYVSANRIEYGLKYSTILAGWYDNPDSLVVDAAKLCGVSGYVCLNPTSPALLGRAYNKLVKCRSTTTDEDIVCLRWILVDVDSVRPTDTSATAEQRVAAHARRDQILREHPDLAFSSIWGSSGNGGYIKVRLPDLPNDELHRTLIASMLASLAAKYSDAVAKIDPPTRNASRIGPLVGTLKCKGDHLPGKQEWTRVTLEGAGGRLLPEDPKDDPVLTPFDIHAWVAANPPPEGATSGRRSRSRPSPVSPAQGGAAPAPGAPAVASVATGVARDERLRRAIAYVAKMDGAISGQGGHNQTFDAACALVKGYDLSVADALPIMEQFNQRCVPPWDQFELHHKVDDADELADDKPRGYLLTDNKPPAKVVDLQKVRSKIEILIAAGDPAALFRDSDLGADLGQLELDGSAEILVFRAKIKVAKGFSARDFDHWVKSNSKSIRDQRKGTACQNSSSLRFESRVSPEAESKSAEGSSLSPIPDIEVTPLHHLVVERVIQALGSDRELYSRGDSLVTVVQEQIDQSHPGSPRIIVLSDAILGCHITAHSNLFIKRKGREDSEEPRVEAAHPPDWLIRAVATQKHFPGIRQLDSVAECPFPRPDGTIVENPGYDRVTKTLYAPSMDFLPLPDLPTREDASAAWARIIHYFRHFPFGSEDDSSVVLMGMLGVVARPAIAGPVPGIAVVGNRAGTGKGLLIDSMAIPGTGRGVTTSAYPEDNAEAVKVKVAIALSGATTVHLDNLEEGASYGSGPLDSALTSTEITDRVLGSNDRPTLPLRAVWFLSGNNLSPGKDAHRRWAVINLTTPLENPEQRTDLGDQPNLRSILLANRAELVLDCLTILKAHSLAGRPKGGWGLMGSFEDWDQVVRGAVWFATGRDCLVTQRAAAASAPERQKKLALLLGLLEIPECRPEGVGLTAKAIFDRVGDYDGLEKHPTLHAIMTHLGRSGRLIESRQLGNFFRGIKNQAVGGLTLSQRGVSHQAILWGVSGSYSDTQD